MGSYGIIRMILLKYNRYEEDYFLTSFSEFYNEKYCKENVNLVSINLFIHPPTI
jgi:hypothetical protein